MLDVNGTTAQSSEQIDVALVEQVVILALETGMRFLLNFKLNITRESTGYLITLSTEIDLVSGLDTTVNGDVKDLPLNDSLLATAALATVALADRLSFTIAILANSLEALDHGAHLAHHSSHTRTVARSASLDGSLLSSTSIALWANNRLLEGEFRNLSAIDIFQVDLVDMVDGTGLLWALLSHTTTEHATKGGPSTEELSEQVFSIHSTTAAILQSFFAVLIINLTFLRVRQDFVGMGKVLEFLGGFRVMGVLVLEK